MIALIFDTETSGLYPGFNVILQLSYQIVDTTDWSVLKDVNHFFAWPESASRVSKEAIELNGLTRDYLATKKLSNRKVALEQFVEDKDSVDIIVAHNIDFDKQFIVESCREENVKFAASGWYNAFDTMKGMTNYCRIPKTFGNGYKWPKLSELADCLHIDYSDLTLHDSTSDVELTKRCFQRAITEGILKCSGEELTISVEVISADVYTFIWSKNGKRLSEEDVALNISKKDIKINQQNAIREWAEKTNQEIDYLVNICRQSPVVFTKDVYQSKLNSLSPKYYIRKSYEEKEPTKDGVRLILENEAEKRFRSILFWKNKPQRNEYVESNLEQRFADMLSAYKQRVATFIMEENQKEVDYNQKAERAYQEQKAHIEGLLNGDVSHLRMSIDDEDKSIEFPLPLEKSYQINKNGHIDVQIMLPQLSDMPHLYGSRLASGNYKIKEMTEVQSRTNYVTCVTGVAYNIAAHYFNAAPSITTIHISASTILTNTDKASVIYRVEFTRDEFIKLDLNTINPIETFSIFPHQISMSKTGVIKPL